ncbi:hypothetical protein [Mobilicoccus pelagius]|uniref:Uncharacterized protein n=1 Tax=Mobilicoccus pelagius NBRC 104925 TaxID=1089455 RepID=H5UQ83_9MICO|nr:hypothetical protein [Mobilicoccus pelagius]GAB47891.1 hypothetical protein MOPEL_030_00010 [Mobilicoccus pelagius NBRC 104925]
MTRRRSLQERNLHAYAPAANTPPTPKSAPDTPAPETPAPSAASPTPTPKARPKTSRTPAASKSQSNAAPPSQRIAIGMYRGDYELARDAYEYAWNHKDFASEVAPNLSAWLGQVFTAWADRTPEERHAILAENHDLIDEQRTSRAAQIERAEIAAGRTPKPDVARPRSYVVPDEVFAAVDEARAADAAYIHAPMSRGQWTREAIRAELARAIKHNGGHTLPVANALPLGGRVDARRF